MDFRVFLIPYFLCSILFFRNFFIESSGFRKIRGSVIRLPNGDSYGHPFDPTRVTQISWRPRFESSLHAKDKLELSKVVDNESGESVASEIRTSSGMFLRKSQDFCVDFLPVENGEAMQVLHYEYGQKYEPHWDYFQDKVNQVKGGHRVATVLMYLSNVRKGGETVFPRSEIKESQPKANGDWSECAKRGYAVKPEKGDALLFFSLYPNATIDVVSLHGSCPVIEGEKWSATKWIHVKNFDKSEDNASDACTDEHENCAKWAAAGECRLKMSRVEPEHSQIRVGSIRARLDLSVIVLRSARARKEL
uniref:procollagen-proline 4-dioxygenase n=1 Tax=Lactuca sativa TaxID=4236 RepID=A0A9R1URS3_LACSA|nr:hypothetical protein LSAT_V11C800440930 [Lactuca sativa]